VLGARVGLLPAGMAQQALVEGNMALQPEDTHHVTHPVAGEGMGDLAVAAKMGVPALVLHSASFSTLARPQATIPL
jgi:hypothetical protein